MAHELAKTLIFSDVIELIAQDYRISLEEARDRFYNSDVIKLFSDDSLGLYGDSPFYVYSLYKKEMKIKDLN